MPSVIKAVIATGILLLACSVVAILIILATIPGNAKNLDGRWDNAPHKEWYASQHNSKGQWCCDESDAEPFAGNYTVNADGSVTLDNGTHIGVEKVLTGSNPTGSPVWWHVGDITFCFALGVLG